MSAVPVIETRRSDELDNKSDNIFIVVTLYFIIFFCFTNLPIMEPHLNAGTIKLQVKRVFE